MELDQQIDKAAEWNTEFRKLIDGEALSTPNDSTKIRVSVSGPLLLHSLELYQGIIVLVDNKLFGSALALLRPHFEAHVRGVWFQWCATENQIKLFLRENRMPMSLGKLIKKIEQVDVYSDEELSSLYAKIKNQLHDYTHGGVAQVMAKISGNEIVSNYNPKLIAEVVMFSSTIVYLTTLAIARIKGNDELAIKLATINQRIYGKAS